MNESTDRGHGNRRWIRIAGIFNLAIGGAFAAIFVFFALRARFQVPYVDDWDWLASLQDPAPFTRALWRLHNEHLIVVPRLLLWMDYWLWTWPGRATLMAGLLSHLVIAAIFIQISFERYERAFARLFSGTILVLIFLTYELQGVVFAASVLLPLVAGFAALSIWSLCRVATAASPTSRRLFICLSAIACVLAALSTTNGIVVPFVLAGLAPLARLSRRTVTAYAALGIGIVSVRLLIGGMPGTTLAMPVASACAFTLAFLGGSLAAVSGPLAVAVGAALTVAAATSVWKVVTDDRRRTPGECTLAGVLVFVLISAAMAGSSRAQYGLNNAAQSRYVLLSSMFWVSVLLFMPPGRLYAQTGSLLAAALGLISIAALPLQVFVGLVWVAKADHLRTASLALAAGVRDDDWSWRISLRGMTPIDPVLPMLSARGARFLRFPGRDDLSPYRDADAPQCGGTVTAIDPNLAGQGSSGLRIVSTLREAGDVLLVSDRDGRIRGLARRAPVVTYGRAFANDFVRAVLRQLYDDRGPGRLSWVGFSARGLGPPYFAELLDEDDRLVCRAPVDCCPPPPPVDYSRSVVGAETIEGYLDVASCSRLAGWAWDQRRPNGIMNIRVTSSSGSTWTVAAVNLRPDLSEKGNGRHAFDVSAPAFQLPPGAWRVEAAEAESGIPLIGSPRTITCPS